MKKKRFLSAVIIFLFMTVLIYSQNTSLPSVTVKSIPENIEDFVALRDNIANTPEGGATVLLLALIIYAQNEELGLQCLTVAFDRSQLTAGNAYKGYKPHGSRMMTIESQLKKSPYIANSYVKGATPKNGYELPEKNLTFEYMINKYSGRNDDYYKLFVYCSGAGSPRPITLKINNRGIWKAYEMSSVVVGVMYPENTAEDDDI